MAAEDMPSVEAALEQGPQAYGLPMTTWTLRDLQALLLRDLQALLLRDLQALLLQERGLTVSVCTLHRVVHALGYRYRRPRHDLRHRQDAQAVAAAKRVLDWLQKKAYLRPDDPLLLDPIWSTWTSARSTPIPIWPQVWRKKGQPMRIPAAGADRKCAIFCSLDYASGQPPLVLSARKDEDRLHDLPRAAPADDSVR